MGFTVIFYCDKAIDPAVKVVLPKGRPSVVSQYIRVTSHSHDCRVDFQVHVNQVIDFNAECVCVSVG